MKRLLLSVFLLAAAALPAPAHFIWVLPPEGKDTKTARIIFSDSLKPDSEELLKKIEKAEVFARGADGKTVALKLFDGKQVFNVTAPSAEPHEIGVVLHYGVSQRGDNPPVLLNYYAKGFTGIKADERPNAKFIENVMVKSWDKLSFDILPIPGPKGQARVVWQDKPVADAEVMLYVPGKDKPIEMKSDKDGLFDLEEPTVSGLYGIRARHIEKKEGELDGKKYQEVRNYVTMVFAVERSEGKAPKPAAVSKTDKEPKPTADPAATKLLADGRAARALWDHFPGFTADVAVNLDGTVTKGKVKVNAKGEVALDLPQGDAAKWALGQLRSIVGHRLSDGSELDTPCAFADDMTDHPLGRAIRVLNDEYHSSYRIKDRQVIEVNRHMGSIKFTITVLENQLNEEKKYLPSTFVVNTWDSTTGALQSNAAHRQEWKRIGHFDLPVGLTVVTASNGKLEARSLTLTNLHLQ
jgi:Protein of unknown function (DUF3386)